MNNQEDRASSAAVLFSGGRDSTLAALICHRDGKYLHLLSFDSGIGYGGELREVRVRELTRVLGSASFSWQLIPNYGLVRKICFSELADDIRQDGYQQILLGESLAMTARAIAYCLQYRVPILVSGASGYQSSFAEQQPEAVDFVRILCGDYGIEFLAPVLGYESEQRVKDELVLAGLSGKSLEASTILADLEVPVSSEVVLQYLKRKRPAVDAYLRSYSNPAVIPKTCHDGQSPDMPLSER